MKHTPLLLALSTVVGCAPARSAVPDEPEPILCPAYSGFSAVGNVWDYTLAFPFLGGWERAQLTALDTTTGDVQVETSGIYDGDAFTYTFERTDHYRCTSDGLYLVDWTNSWVLDNLLASKADSSTGQWDPAAQIMLSDDEMVEEHANWSVEATRTQTLPSGVTYTGGTTMVFERMETQTLSIMGTTIDAIPVEYYVEGVYDNVPWIWYAEDIGIVKRSGLTLDSYSLGSGALMK